MLIKIGAGLLGLIVLFLFYVSTRKGRFYYERSGHIEASPEKIFPYISNFRMGEQWSPYEKLDPNMKKLFIGQDASIGSKMEFQGNKEAGSGSLEITKLVDHEVVEIKLIMLAPIRAENLVRYRLSPEGSGTRFTWSMEGDGGFMGKLVTLFIDCEKMAADQFTVGINNLKSLMERKAS